jgi:hypothetical protein
MTATQVGGPAFGEPTGSADEAQDVPALGKPDWPNGLKLLPEHFEAQDRYHEDFVRRAVRMAFDQPWEVSELVIDEEALASGQVRVARLRAIFRDTTPVLAGVSGASGVPPRDVTRQTPRAAERAPRRLETPPLHGGSAPRRLGTPPLHRGSAPRRLGTASAPWRQRSKTPWKAPAPWRQRSSPPRKFSSPSRSSADLRNFVRTLLSLQVFQALQR